MKGKCVDNSRGCVRLLEIGKIYDLSPSKYVRATETKFSVIVPNTYKGISRFDLYKWRFKLLPGNINNNVKVL